MTKPSEPEVRKRKELGCPAQALIHRRLAKSDAQRCAACHHSDGWLQPRVERSIGEGGKNERVSFGVHDVRKTQRSGQVVRPCVEHMTGQLGACGCNPLAERAIGEGGANRRVSVGVHDVGKDQGSVQVVELWVDAKTGRWKSSSSLYAHALAWPFHRVPATIDDWAAIDDWVASDKVKRDTLRWHLGRAAAR